MFWQRKIYAYGLLETGVWVSLGDATEVSDEDIAQIIQNYKVYFSNRECGATLRVGWGAFDVEKFIGLRFTREKIQ